jgi:hypothetical protein
MGVLTEMLSPDMLRYCEEHHLLYSILENAAPSQPGEAAASEVATQEE